MTNTTDTPKWDGPLQILSLDGGGLKGLYTAAVLAKIEEKHDVNITDHFDLITGTSTGGLIAIGLGLGLRPHELVDFYTNTGSKVFSNRLGWRSLLSWVRCKFPEKELKAAVTDSRVFGHRTLGESTKRLVIPSYNLGKDSVRVFKTAHHSRLKTDWKIPAWQVAMATGAAPTYFPACRHIEGMRLIDGGVWANNPTVVGIAEGVGVLGASLNQISVLSMGTTGTRVHRKRSLDSGGIAQWIGGKHILQVLMEGQSAGFNGLGHHLLGSEKIIRIDPTVPEKMYSLDKANSLDLLAEAEDTALHEGDKIHQMFFDHIATPFKPTYQKGTQDGH